MKKRGERYVDNGKEGANQEKPKMGKNRNR